MGDTELPNGAEGLEKEAAVGAHQDGARVHAESVGQWRDWLVDNHTDADGVWLVSWKTATGRPRISYEESVLEALCVGWIDSLAGTLDDERSTLWFGPRKPGSGWSRPNKERIAKLELQGRLLPAGMTSIALAKANGAWTALDDIENLVVPDDLAAALTAGDAWTNWDEFPRSTKRAILVWISQPKAAATRAKRIAEAAEKTSRGERAR